MQRVAATKIALSKNTERKVLKRLAIKKLIIIQGVAANPGDL